MQPWNEVSRESKWLMSKICSRISNLAKRLKTGFPTLVFLFMCPMSAYGLWNQLHACSCADLVGFVIALSEVKDAGMWGTFVETVLFHTS